MNSTFARIPSTVNRQPSTVNRQPSTVNRQPSTVNRQPSTVNRQRTTVVSLPGGALGGVPAEPGRGPYRKPNTENCLPPPSRPFGRSTSPKFASLKGEETVASGLRFCAKFASLKAEETVRTLLFLPPAERWGEYRRSRGGGSS